MEQINSNTKDEDELEDEKTIIESLLNELIDKVD